MSNAVLIIDMPECCGGCPLMEDDPSGGYCIAHDDYIDIPDTMGGKPDWCPLRKLPDKKDSANLPGRSQIKAWGNGWNACLDVIEGNEKDFEPDVG